MEKPRRKLSNVVNSPQAVIFLTVFLDLFAFALVLPKLQLYANDLGARGAVRGALISSYAFMGFIFAPIWGRLSDRVGRRPVIMWCVVGSLLSFIMLAFSRTLPLLFMSRAIGGMAAGNISAAQAYLADITPKEKRTKAMGMLGAAFGLGFIFGPGIGGVLGKWGDHVLGGHGGIVFLGVGGGIVCVVNLIWVLRFLPESRIHVPSEGILGTSVLRTVLESPRLLTLLLLFAAINFAWSNMESTFIIMIYKKHGWRDDMGAFLLAYVGILTAIIYGVVVHRVSKAIGDGPTLRLGAFLAIPGLALLSWAPNLGLLMLVMLVLALSGGLGNPTLQSIVSRTAPPDIQGGIFGVVQGIGSFCRIVGPLVGNTLIEKNVQYPYSLAGAVVAGAFVATLFVPLPGREAIAAGAGPMAAELTDE